MDYIWRTRSRGTILNAYGGSSANYYCNGTIQSQNSGNLYAGYAVGEVEECLDTVHPDFSRRKAAGEIMNTPIRLQKRKCSGTNSTSYNITYSNPDLTCTGTNFINRMTGTGNTRNLNTAPGFGCTFDPYMQIEQRNSEVLAGTKAWAGVKSPDIQGTVFAAELGKTIAMFKRPLDNLNKFIKKVKRTKRYKTWATARNYARLGSSIGEFLAAEWLRYRYGIMPIFYDIEGVKKILRNPLVSPRMTSRASDKFNSGTLTYVSPYSETFFSGSSTFTRVVDVSVSAGILYEHECILHDRYGYGLDQQLSAIYEIIPYSFVLDWVVNLGDYIAAISPKVGVKVLAQWTTTRITDARGCVAYATPVSPQFYTVTGKLDVTSQEVHTYYGRQPIARSGLVNLTKTWDIGKVRDQKRILDTIALTINLLKSR